MRLTYIVDAHCHASPYWYEPVETLLFHMDRNSIAYGLLVQYMGQFDNSYQSECVRRFPDRLASVVLVDAQQPNAATELERLAEGGAKGVRLRVDTRSPGDDALAIWRKAAELGLPVTCGGTTAEFASDAFVTLVGVLPDLPIILEHLGSINRPDGEGAPYSLRQQVFTLSRFPNVYIKVHGLGEFCQRNTPVTMPFPFETPIPPILEMAYEAFGPDRMMWGSDYPPVSGREGYANALRYTREALAKKGLSACEKIFGGTAQQLYGL